MSDNKPKFSSGAAPAPTPTPEDAAKALADQQAAADAALRSTAASDVFDKDVNLDTGNLTTGVQGSLSAAQILALQSLSEGPGSAFATSSSTTPAGFYSVGKGSVRHGGKVYTPEKIGGRFYYDPEKLPQSVVIYLATLIPSGIMVAVDAQGNILDENGERT